MRELINTKDRKILEQMEINARQSNTQIAKKLGLSKDVVSYRIRKMEEKGIISGYYSVLDVTKLGYITFKFMLTFHNTPSEVESEIREYLKNSPHVGWVVDCDGYYNLMVVTWVKNAIMFDNFFNRFLSKYCGYLKERDIIIITENHACRKAYLFDKKCDESPDIFYSGEAESLLDDKDRAIVRFLAKDAKKPLHEIAGSLSLTGEAVAHRLKQLQKKQVIQAFRPVINTTLFGYQYYNILFRLSKSDNISKIFSFFKGQPNIIYFVRYLGSYDIGIDLEVKKADELRKILRQVKDLFSEDIESYHSILIYQEHKITYLPENKE